MKWFALSLLFGCTTPGTVGQSTREVVQAGVAQGLGPDELAARVGQRAVIDTRKPEDQVAIRIADYELREGSALPMATNDVLIYWIERDDLMIGALYRNGTSELWQARILPP